MKYLKFAGIGIMVIVIATQCGSDPKGPIEKDTVPPGQISNVIVSALSGAVKISYTLPSDPDLLYVVAEYTNKMGRKFEFKSSYYTNSLIMNGFGDVSPYDVTMYAVDRSGNRSASVTKSVTPNTPPVLVAYSSLELVADFGGIRVSFENPSKADLSIVVRTPDLEGKMAIATTYYTASEKGYFVMRGYAPKSRKFEVYIADRWGNTSDVRLAEITPILEVQLDKAKFKEVFLPGDSPGTTYGGALRKMWDGSTTPGGGRYYHSGNAPSTVPKMLTFDLGVEAKLSRFALQAPSNDIFNDVALKKYEIWGTITLDPSGSFDGWTKLLDVTSVKPSGLPRGQLTAEDREAGKRGDERGFSINLPRVRFIRIRCLENWSGSTNMVISEVTFWGTE